METNFVSYQIRSLGAEVSQDPLDRFSQSLHRMVGIELQMNDTSFFFRYPKGRCHGNQLSGKMGQNYLPPALIRNGMGYHLANMHINSSTNCSTLSENMLKIHSVVFEKK